MTGEPAKIFHGVGIGPLSKILAVKLQTLKKLKQIKVSYKQYCMSSQEEEVIETESGVPIETHVHRKVKTEVVTVENNNNPKNIRAQSEYRAFKTSPLPVQPDSNREFEPQPIYEEEIEDNFQDVESNSDFEENKPISCS